MRTALIILAYAISLAIQFALFNPVCYYFWLAGFFPGRYPTAWRWFWVCAGGIVALLVGQIIGAWLLLRRSHDGHCRRCNHDLTGNVSGVCPGCAASAVAGQGERGQ